MASSTIKTITKDISNSVNFVSPVSNIFYKNASISGQLLHVNFEVHVGLSTVQENTWFDIGTINLPAGVNLSYAKYIPFIGTDVNFAPVLDGLLRISATKLQMLINNKNGNYMFVNGVIQLNN